MIALRIIIFSRKEEQTCLCLRSKYINYILGKSDCEPGSSVKSKMLRISLFTPKYNVFREGPTGPASTASPRPLRSFPLRVFDHEFEGPREQDRLHGAFNLSRGRKARQQGDCDIGYEPRDKRLNNLELPPCFQTFWTQTAPLPATLRVYLIYIC